MQKYSMKKFLDNRKLYDVVSCGSHDTYTLN